MNREPALGRQTAMVVGQRATEPSNGTGEWRGESGDVEHHHGATPRYALHPTARHAACQASEDSAMGSKSTARGEQWLGNRSGECSDDDAQVQRRNLLVADIEPAGAAENDPARDNQCGHCADGKRRNVPPAEREHRLLKIRQHVLQKMRMRPAEYVPLLFPVITIPVAVSTMDKFPEPKLFTTTKRPPGKTLTSTG